MTDIDIHALAALPYGQANSKLKAAGFWDEHADDEANFKDYRVRIEGQTQWTATVTVQARSDDEAEKLASHQVESGTCLNMNYGEDEIHAVEVNAKVQETTG